MNFFLFLILFLPVSIFAKVIPIQVEIVKTEQARTFGLMQRKFLPENQGMLFIHPEKEHVRIWMFNCFIDLSIAFLDEETIVREIHELKAYPKKMKGISIKNYQQLMAYPGNTNVALFFMRHSVQASFPVSYTLEMNKGWFANHKVKVGARLHFNQDHAYIETK